MQSSDRNPALNDVIGTFNSMKTAGVASIIIDTGTAIDPRLGQFTSIVETANYYVLSYYDPNLQTSRLVFADKATMEVAASTLLVGVIPRAAQQVGDYVFLLVDTDVNAQLVQIVRLDGNSVTLTGQYKPLFEVEHPPLVAVGATYFSNASGEGWILGCYDTDGNLYTAVQYGGDLDNPNFQPSNWYLHGIIPRWIKFHGVSFLQQAGPPVDGRSSIYFVELYVEESDVFFNNHAVLRAFSEDFSRVIGISNQTFAPNSPPGQGPVSFLNGPSASILNSSTLNILASQAGWACDGDSCRLTINRFG